VEFPYKSVEDVCVTFPSTLGLRVLSVIDAHTIPHQDDYGDTVVEGAREFLVYCNTVKQVTQHDNCEHDNSWVEMAMDSMDVVESAMVEFSNAGFLID